MNTSRLPTVGLGITAVACALASAAAQDRGFYIRADAGGLFMSDTELHEYFGVSVPGRRVEFEPGPRFGFVGGYQLTDWFAPELETGFMGAEIDSITGANRVDAVFTQVPLLGNLRFQMPERFITPYLGGGAGVSFAGLSVDDIALDGTRIDGSEVDVVFAYQAFGGLRFRLNERMGLSLEYRYFASCEPSWEADDIAGEIRFGEMETHAISIAFDLKF